MARSAEAKEILRRYRAQTAPTAEEQALAAQASKLRADISVQEDQLATLRPGKGEYRRIARQIEALEEQLHQGNARLEQLRDQRKAATVAARVEALPDLERCAVAVRERLSPALAAVGEGFAEQQEVFDAGREILPGGIPGFLPPPPLGRARIDAALDLLRPRSPRERDPDLTTVRVVRRYAELSKAAAKALSEVLGLSVHWHFERKHFPGDLVGVPREHAAVLVKSGLCERYMAPAEPAPDRVCDPEGFRDWEVRNLVDPAAWRAVHRPEPVEAAHA